RRCTPTKSRRCFVNGTTTPGRYPLSLHDALPISQAEVAGLVELEQLGHLVLRQRLGREQVQRLGTLLQRRAHHRQRVAQRLARGDRKSTRLNSSHVKISYAVFCLKRKNT